MKKFLSKVILGNSNSYGHYSFIKWMFENSQQRSSVIVRPNFYQYSKYYRVMRIIGAIKNVIYNSDLMNSGSLLRVKGDPTHNTLLGGAISISLMLVLAALFWNKIIDTIDKKIITSSAATTNADDPLPLNLTTLGSGPFMFGVEVWHHDLNTGPRLFDIVLTNTQYNYGEPSNGTLAIPLEACTRSHWDGFPTIQQKFDQLFIGYWKCLPKDRSFEIMGKYSSVKSRTLDVSVKKCTNSSQQSRPCAPQADIDQYFIDNGTQFFTIYFLNPLINPDSADYLKYYLEDSNYITFTANSGEESRLFVDDYKISTDQSIYPFQDVKEESGGVVMGNPLKSVYSTIGNTYAVFFFFKSPVSISYVRSFQKLDEVLAYIGGLFGTIIIAFFLMSSYNAYKYEINLAGYLYRSEQGGEKLEKGYNFFYYLGQLLYTVLRALSCEPKWERLSYYYETRQEMLRQLDVLYLLKRVNFLENTLTFLFTNHQIKGLHLTNHISLSEAVSLRKTYRLKSKVKNAICAKRMRKINDQSLQQHAIVDSKQDMFPNTQLSPNFDSDHYSSDDSSDSDKEGNRRSLEAIKTLRNEQKSNPTSKKILKSMDKRLDNIVQAYFSKSVLTRTENDNSQEFTANNIENHISHENHNLFLTMEQVHEQQQNNKKPLNFEEESQKSMNSNYAKIIFERIKSIHVQPLKPEDE